MISIIALTLAAAVAPAPEVTGVSVSPVADRTEVVIQIDGAVSASDFALDDPARVVLDLSGMGAVRNALYKVGRGGVRSVRIAPFQPGVVRVVIGPGVCRQVAPEDPHRVLVPGQAVDQEQRRPLAPQRAQARIHAGREHPGRIVGRSVVVHDDLEGRVLLAE